MINKTIALAVIGIGVGLAAYAAADCYITSNGNCVSPGSTCSWNNGAENYTGKITGTPTQLPQCGYGTPGNVDCGPNTNKMDTCTYTCSVTINNMNGDHSQNQSQPENQLKGATCN